MMGKLRNKKTGEVVTIGQELGDDFDGVGLMLWVDHVESYELDDYKIYGSLDELNEEWEDYKPAEPLIKDKKIRKAVRAWGDMNQIRKAAIQRILIESRGFEDSWFQISGEDVNNCIWKIEIHAPYSETVSKDYEERMVDIAELCGEEEE